MNRSATTAKYWRQVHAVQRQTGASSAAARRAVSALRSERGYTTAADIKRHPIIVQRAASAAERAIKREREPDEPDDRKRRRGGGVIEGEGVGGGAGGGRGRTEKPVEPKAYQDLNDWIATWEDYYGDYDYIEVETNADY